MRSTPVENEVTEASVMEGPRLHLRCRLIDSFYHIVSMFNSLAFVQLSKSPSNNAAVLIILVDFITIYYHLVRPQNDRLFYLVIRVGIWIFDVLHHLVLIPFDVIRCNLLLYSQPTNWLPSFLHSVASLCLHCVMSLEYGEHVAVLIASLSDIPNRRAHGAGDM